MREASFEVMAAHPVQLTCPEQLRETRHVSPRRLDGSDIGQRVFGKPCSKKSPGLGRFIAAFSAASSATTATDPWRSGSALRKGARHIVIRASYRSFRGREVRGVPRAVGIIATPRWHARWPAAQIRLQCLTYQSILQLEEGARRSLVTLMFR